MNEKSQPRLKVGVVGASIAHSPDARENFAIRAHLPALKAMSAKFEVRAVCTTRMESANEAAERFDVPLAFDSVERMLVEAPDLDIVCVSVKPAGHYDVVMAALKAGKHVYCEHPAGINSQQARKMWQTAEAGGLRSITGHQGHFDPAILEMARLSRSGYVGTPLAFGATHFGANYITPRPYFHRWLFDVTKGGRPAYRSGHSFERIGAVLGLDVTSLCADFTIKVPARPALDRPETQLLSDQVDNMNYLLRCGEAVGTLQVSNTAWSGTGDSLQLYGTEGMLMVVDNKSAVSFEAGPGGDERGFRLYGFQADVQSIIDNRIPPEKLGHYSQLKVPSNDYGVNANGRPAHVVPAWLELAAAIEEGRECAPSLRDTFKIHCIWDAAEKSVKGRTWVDVAY